MNVLKTAWKKNKLNAASLSRGCHVADVICYKKTH